MGGKATRRSTRVSISAIRRPDPPEQSAAAFSLRRNTIRFSLALRDAITKRGPASLAPAGALILERIELAIARHHNGKRPQHVQHPHAAGVMRQHVRQPPVSHRALVEVGADQRHAARLQPCIHFRAREMPFGFLAAEQAAGAMHGRMERRPGGLAVAVAPSAQFCPYPEILLTFAGLQRVCCWAGQAPGHARGRIIKVDHTIDAALRHCFHNYGAEPAPFRRRHRRPLALGPAHGEGVAVGPPADIDTTRIRRQRPVFAGVGGELAGYRPGTAAEVVSIEEWMARRMQLWRRLDELSGGRPPHTTATRSTIMSDDRTTVDTDTKDQRFMNVIPIERGRERPYGPPLPLREAILMGIEWWASDPDPTEEFTQGRVEGLVCALRDAGMPFEPWKDELSAEALAGLCTLKIDLGFDDDDPLRTVDFVSIGSREIGAIEKRHYGSIRAFQRTPAGFVDLGTFPNFETAKQALVEADTGASPADLPDSAPPAT